jgi:hypothetical protein
MIDTGASKTPYTVRSTLPDIRADPEGTGSASLSLSSVLVFHGEYHGHKMKDCYYKI